MMMRDNSKIENNRIKENIIKENKEGNNQKGFTLVEVIVVLVVLAVLAAIAVPTFTGFIKKAEDKRAIADCKLCVATAQDLINQHYMKFTDEEAFGRLVSPINVVAGAGIEGIVQGMYLLPEDSKSLMHLQFTTGDQGRTVQFCLLKGNHENSCGNGGESYKIKDEKTDSERYDEAFGQVLGIVDKDQNIKDYLAGNDNPPLDSASIDKSASKPNRITRVWNSMSDEFKEFLTDKTWQIRNTNFGVRSRRQRLVTRLRYI